MDILVETSEDARVKFEYNCGFRRILPWANNANLGVGCAEATIAPFNATTPHQHDYSEIFFITEGVGLIHIAGKSKKVRKGDLIIIPPNAKHSLENINKRRMLKMMCIWEKIL